MSDDDSDNILNFPHEIVAKRYIDLEIRDEQMHTENRKSVLALLKNTEKTVNENERLTTMLGSWADHYNSWIKLFSVVNYLRS